MIRRRPDAPRGIGQAVRALVRGDRSTRGIGDAVLMIVPGYELRGNPITGQLPGGPPLRVRPRNPELEAPVHALWGQF